MYDSQFQRLSVSVNYLRFPLICFIVMLHCYTMTAPYVSNHPLYFAIIYPFNLWMGETGVPAFFFISGLLFFYSRKSYEQKLRSRLKTLLIPYLFFNALALLGYLGLWMLGKPLLVFERSIADYSFIDYIRAFWDKGSWMDGNSSPVLPVFWYLRNLMILTVISPVLAYIIKCTHLLLPLVSCLLWINSPHSAYSLQSLTMFSLGAWFPLSGVSLMSVVDRYKSIVISLFLVFGSYDLLSHWCPLLPSFLQVHRLSLVANTFFLLWLGAQLAHRFVMPSVLTRMSFFIFCIHYFFVLALNPVFIRVSACSDVAIVMVYFLSVFAVLFASALSYLFLSRFFPNLLNYITGHRS